MRMMRINISISEEETEALLELAKSQLRDPRVQARLIIRQDLERRGFLPESELSDDSGGMLVILNQVIQPGESCNE